MNEIIISRQGLGEMDELPADVTNAAPGQIVVVADGPMRRMVFVDCEQVGTVLDESAARLERGAFAAHRNGRRQDSFHATLEDAARAAAGIAKPATPEAGTAEALRPLVAASNTAGVAHLAAYTTVPQAGDVAWVWARGSYRRGQVVSVTRTRATVAYLTATSAEHGRVHSKADVFSEVLIDA